MFTPLRSARDHATKSLLAWLLALAGVVLLASNSPHLLLWPEVDYRVEGEVVDIEHPADDTVVTFEGSGELGPVTWTRYLDEDSDWTYGEDITGWVDEDGYFYQDTGLGWLGPAGSLFIFLMGLYLIFVVRRTIGLWVASWDVRRGQDEPILGYVALVDNPIPRMGWRPVLLLWRQDPTKSQPTPFPDDSFLADEETGKEMLSSDIGSVRVWEAWVDTGRLWHKPRWVGTKDGVLIPHRAISLAGALAAGTPRKHGITGPIEMPYEAPDPTAPSIRSTSGSDHNFLKMLLRRGVIVLLIALIAGFFASSDEFVTVIG